MPSNTQRQIRYFIGNSILRCRIGHNLQDEGGSSFLCPFDADKKRLVSTCINLSVISMFAATLGAKQQLYVLDACHSGALLSQLRGGLEWGIHLSAKPAVLGMTAVSNNEEALENQGRGIFSKVRCHFSESEFQVVS